MSRIRRHAALALTLACLLAGGRAGAQPAARADDATFMLLTVTAEGKAVGFGTAFFVNGDGTALTNSHIVHLARQNPKRYGLLAIVGQEFYGVSLVCANALPYDPESERAVLGRDIAEVKLVPSRLRSATYEFGGIVYNAHLTRLPSFPVLKLGDDPSEGATVHIVGYGLIGLPPTPGLRWTATGTVDQVGDAPDGTPVFRVVSANRPRKGNSGSPVLDAASRVVGMWTWDEDESLAYGVAIASSALARPCGTNGAAGPIGPAAVTPR